MLTLTLKRLDRNTIDNIREGKRDGRSLKDLAQEFGCTKSTVSYYCRDLFTHPMRKYQTLEDVRKSHNESKKARYATGKRCPSDFKNYPSRHAIRKMYPCVSCGKPMSRKGSLCINCYTEKLKERKISYENKKKEKIDRELERLKRLDAKFKQDICPINGAHHWIIDSNNIGQCRYCKAIKNFGVLNA